MQLKTFGGLWIEGSDNNASLGPRRMGLLALVAAAGRKGVSRDRVIGILWPETEEEQARHTLSQSLYTLKRETGRDWIVGSTELRIEPSIRTDVGAFLEALAAGDAVSAADSYTDKFLDGFHLTGAPEFERWVEEERSRLHQKAIAAIEGLAAQAVAAGDRPAAVRWWGRLCELDPLSARYASGHMRALVAAGDRPAALARARQHAEAVRRELDAEPDPTVRDLEASIRKKRLLPALAAALADPVASPAPQEASTLPAAPARAAWRRALIPVGLVGAVLLALILRGGSGGSESESGPFLAVVAIRGASNDSTRPGTVLRDMLATSLGGVEGLRVVANSRLVELIARVSDTAPGATTDAARRAGATEVIEGELSSDRSGLVLSLRRVALESGVVRRGYVVHAADPLALVDSAAAAIARDLRRTPPASNVAQIRTSSQAAYALYDEGLRANYGYDAPAAFRLMKAALQRDSNFAMAAYFVWQLSRAYPDQAYTAAAMARAKRLATRTIDRERLLMLGSIAEVDAPLRQALAIAETLTVKYPSDPEGQILLGDVQGRAGDWKASVAAYNKAIALDSTAGTLSGPYCRVCAALNGMCQQYLWWDSAAAAERSGRRLIALRPDEPSAWNNLIEPLLRQGRRKEAEAALEKGNPNGSATRDPVNYRDDVRWGRYEAVDRALRQDAESGSWDTRAEAWWLLILSLRDQGRLREADSIRLRWHSASVSKGWTPSSHPGDMAMLGLERGDPQQSIRSFRFDAERTALSKDPPGVRNRYLVWFLTQAGAAYAAAGDTATVRRLADSLESLGQTTQFGRDARLHYFLRGLLFQRQGRHAEAVDAFQRSLFSLTDGYTRTNLMMARSLLALHRAKEAIAVLQPAIRGGVDGSNTYVSRTELHEALAQAFEQAGQPDSARAHYRAVESAWRRADLQFRDRYLRAKAKAGLEAPRPASASRGTA